jgi:hypothetical protein
MNVALPIWTEEYSITVRENLQGDLFQVSQIQLIDSSSSVPLARVLTHTRNPFFQNMDFTEWFLCGNPTALLSFRILLSFSNGIASFTEAIRTNSSRTAAYNVVS